MLVDKLNPADFQYDSNAEGWQSEVPTDPNTLWFFIGKAHRIDRDDELLIVEIRSTANLCTMYIAHGQFIYPEREGGSGLWKRIQLKLPTTQPTDTE